MIRSLPRIPRTLLRGQSGFTLIESLVALTLLAFTLSGVVAAAGTFNGATKENRTRQNANNVASDQIEQARALSFNDLKLNAATTPPATYTDTQGTTSTGDDVTYTTAAGGIVVSGGTCPACIPYTKTVTRAGTQFTITQMVLKLAAYTDDQGKTQNLKKLIVTAAWTGSKGATQSVRLDTIINNQDYLNAPTPTGVHVEVQDDTDPGAAIDDDDLAWNVTVTNASTGVTVASGATTEGVYENTTIPAGSYKCTISRSDTTLGYYPEGSTPVGAVGTIGCNGGASPEAFTIVDGDLTPLVSHWSLSLTCASSTVTGNMNMTVKDPDGNVLPNVNISLLGATNGTHPSYHTNNDGVAVMTNLKADSYSYTATLPGYGNAEGDPTVTGDFCIYAGATVATKIIMSDLPPAGTLAVKVTNKSGIGGNSTYLVTAGALQQTLTITKDNNKTATWSGVPVDTYNVTVCRQVSVGNCSSVATPVNASVTDGHTTTVNVTAIG